MNMCSNCTMQLPVAFVDRLHFNTFQDWRDILAGIGGRDAELRRGFPISGILGVAVIQSLDLSAYGFVMRPRSGRLFKFYARARRPSGVACILSVIPTA